MIPSFINFETHDYWLITWTTYGTWLPGDKRGYVSNSPEASGLLELRNKPRTKYADQNEAWEARARQLMKGKPIYLQNEQSKIVFAAIEQVSNHRSWQLLTTAIMNNHVHVLVGITVGTNSNICLRDFKAYSSRELNIQYGKPSNGTWWTTSGSRRWKRDWPQLYEKILYVQNQYSPLHLWTHPELSDIKSTDRILKL